MAVVDVEEPGNGRRRKRRIERRLIVDEKVEVRSLEDGFLGSWHCGTVIECNKGVRHVMYDHLLLNDGSDFLVDVVEVSAVLDDINSSNSNSYSRGYIRPIPPKVDCGKWGLPYGLCVDAYYQDAWWEGVIFDHEDGLEKRRIFFPDLGDELKVGVDALRITQDWDEATGDWQRRGTWLFLELIDQYEQIYYLPVSLKQIWYEVRAKKDFMKIGEWTSAVNNLWEELVKEVIEENLEVTLKEMVRVFQISSSVVTEPSEADVDVKENPQVNLVDNDGILTTGDMVKCDMIIGNGSNRENAFSYHGLTMEEVSKHNSSITRQKLPFIKFKNVSKQTKRSEDGNSFKWQPLSSIILPDAASCPAAITEYLKLGKKKPNDTLLKDVLMHLSYHGWKCERRQDRAIRRFTSPNGRYFYSLREVCELLMEPSMEIPPSISSDEMGLPPSISHNETGILQESCDEIFTSQVLEQTERSPSPEQSFETALGGVDIVSEKTEFFHEDVPDSFFNLNRLYKNGLKNKHELISKGRNYLLTWGWRLTAKYNGRRERWYYTSPLGRTYPSLSSACKVCSDEKGVYESNGRPACRSMKRIYITKNTKGEFVRNEIYSASSNMDVLERLVPSNSNSGESRSTSTSEGLVVCCKNRFQENKKLRTKANLFKFSSNKLNGKEYESHIQSVGKKYMRRIRSPSAVKQRLNRGHKAVNINKFADDMECSRSAHMLLRSSKRVHEVVTPMPSHHNPRTILSWLIDHDVVLPRARVYYCKRKGLRPIAEGRISRDGIKCCCCQKVFTLNGFEIHAGSTSSRSAASIFLEDGKSLFDCQILCNKKIRNYKREEFDCRKGGSPKGDNDYICSICHFGGILILCDQCPSSFHQSCLGLKDIPEGDWFCSSCCCRICGQNKLIEDTNILDEPFLTCHQCEHKYHVKCLGIKGIPNSGCYLNAYWFCNKQCEEIHRGLQRLLGKSIPVGDDKLTWSLLKATNSDSHYLNPPNIETLTQNHSKLNVALSVMHECFEPVMEPHTRRDLVEDVIFSRRSELKRLDFQGFYTVLLERDDELISVASIRVYGEKVAEIPLVGTRFQYRRLGMCRILMNELEKRLRELGVQRLVLPAVSSVLNTWTTSFGFSKMTASERLGFVDYTFLDFQETIMCQKFLLENSVVPSAITEISKRRNDVSKPSNGTTHVDESSAMTDVHQATQTKEISIMIQRQVGIPAGNNSPHAEFVATANLTNKLPRNSRPVENFAVCMVEGYKSGDDCLKCYKRRKKLISC